LFYFLSAIQERIQEEKKKNVDTTVQIVEIKEKIGLKIDRPG